MPILATKFDPVKHVRRAAADRLKCRMNRLYSRPRYPRRHACRFATDHLDLDTRVRGTAGSARALPRIHSAVFSMEGICALALGTSGLKVADCTTSARTDSPAAQPFGWATCRSKANLEVSDLNSTSENR